MLSVKQGDIKYQFLSLWYDSTWNWTLISTGKKKFLKNLPSIGFCRSNGPQIENKRKRKHKQVLGSCQRNKKMRNLRMTMIPKVFGALGTVSKGLEKRLEELKIKGRILNLQTAALLTSTRILRRVLENWGNLLSLRLQWKTHREKNNNSNYKKNLNVRPTNAYIFL